MQILQAKRERQRERERETETETETEECRKRDGKIAPRGRTPARRFLSRLSTNKSSCAEDTAHVRQAAKIEREMHLSPKEHTREALGHLHFFNMTRQESVDDDDEDDVTNRTRC